MKRFLLDLTATALNLDYFLVEIADAGRVVGYLLRGPLRAEGEDAVSISESTLEAARDTWKLLVAAGGVRIDPASEAFDRALEEALCADGCCDHYVCTEGRALAGWNEPEPSRWDYASEAFGPSAEL